VLDDVTFLVGRNGAGKSTLMDALSFVSEAVTDSLSTALERRGNLESVRQRQPAQGARYDVSVAVRLQLDEGGSALYGFKIGTDRANRSYAVKQEVLRAESMPEFERSRKEFRSSDPSVQPALDPETLVFPLIAGSNESWKRIIEALRLISVHQFSPQAIRSEPLIGSEQRLSRDGHNAGDVLKRLDDDDDEWITQRLSIVIPGIRLVSAFARQGRRVIRFAQRGKDRQTNYFSAPMMSDGTMRSLGILLALRQTPRPSIVLIDEIEDSLHPHAHGVLLDAIEAASDEFPVVVSTHNPEILSHPSASGNRIRVIQWNNGASGIYHLSEPVLANLKPPQTVGRLLRSNALWTEDQPSTVGIEADFFKMP